MGIFPSCLSVFFSFVVGADNLGLHVKLESINFGRWNLLMTTNVLMHWQALSLKTAFKIESSFHFCYHGESGRDFISPKLIDKLYFR